jgi:ADP-heptose:LPS heptosyltransferase
MTSDLESDDSSRESSALVHLASGIGNIVLATPLLVALNQMGVVVDLLIDGDYSDTADLFRDWSAVRSVRLGNIAEVMRRGYQLIIPAVPPFYWPRFARLYGRDSRIVARPPNSLFYEDEQEYYLSFARRAGYPADLKPYCTLPIAPSDSYGVTSRTLVIAPGCKTGEMAAKRWPYFAELAECFNDVAVVGTEDDARRADGTVFPFPAHARVLLSKLSLRETAETMAAAGAVVGNDSGLCHLAGAAGVPTVIIFGPTPSVTLGKFPPNVVIVRAGLECEPCWFGDRFRACDKRIDCLHAVSVEDVARVLRGLMGLDRRKERYSAVLSQCYSS